MQAALVAGVQQETLNHLEIDVLIAKGANVRLACLDLGASCL